MSSIAIITARGGSKRIPKKNIRPFCGKPIIAYSIEAALECGRFDEVMVSTDSEEIAAIAKEYGASVPFLRSGETAGDFATTADVIREVLLRYEEEGKHFDSFMCLYPTAPFITADILSEAWKNFDGANTAQDEVKESAPESGKGLSEWTEQGAPDAVVPVVRFSFPPQRGFVVKDGLLAYKWPEYRSMRSQDLEPFYHDAGQFYLVRTDAFMRENTVVPENTAPLVLPETMVQDIDNEDDWILAEMCRKYYPDY